MIRTTSLAIITFFTFTSKAQKVLSEGAITYNINISKVDDNASNGIDGATSTVFLKGTQSRVDMKSALGIESTLHDAKTGNSTILKEYSGQKLMITLTKENWLEKNSQFGEVKFDITADTKVVAGYNCKKATGKTKNGNTISVYYTPDVTVANKDYNIAFKNLPGLALEYEINNGKTIFKYSIEKISFDPVLAAKFDIPTSGYRLMTYEENKKMKRGER